MMEPMKLDPEDFDKWLRELRSDEVYRHFFERLGPEALQHFERLVNDVERFIDLLKSQKLIDAMMYYGHLWKRIHDICEAYADSTRSDLPIRLNAELVAILYCAIYTYLQ